MPHADREASKKYHREYQREWVKRNPEKIAEYRKRHYGKHKEYYAKRAKAYHEAHPDRRKENWRHWSYDARLKRKYGISGHQFEYMLSQQKHCCAICRKPFPSSKDRHLDHCHEQCIVRGILCSKCNLAIGLLQNNPSIALEAAHYLQKSELFTNSQPANLTNAALSY